jgi:GDP-D-mannose dehydratase
MTDQRTFPDPASRPPRVLVTGGAGFLGSHLCERFLARGWEVLCMDNLVTGDMRNIEHLFKEERFHFEKRDVTEHIHVPGRLDAILHFASPASPIDYLELPIQTLKVGSLGSRAPASATAIRWSTRRRRTTGATSTPWGRAASTTRPSASPRR